MNFGDWVLKNIISILVVGGIIYGLYQLILWYAKKGKKEIDEIKKGFKKKEDVDFILESDKEVSEVKP